MSRGHQTQEERRYDLKAADRKRNLFIQIGLTSVVVVFAVALVLYIVMSADDKPTAGEAESIRVASSSLIKKEGTDEPKAVRVALRGLPVPALRRVRAAVRAHGRQAHRLRRDRRRLLHGRASWTAQGDGLLVAGGGRGLLRGRRIERRVPAVPCRAVRPAAQRDRRRLPRQRPAVEVARQAGAAGDVPECINKGTYVDMVDGPGRGHRNQSTPTIRINGEDYEYSTPDALVAKIKEIVGDVPALDAAPPPAPEPTSLGRSRTRTGAMTVAAPSAVQPSEPASAAADGVAVRRASALWVLIAGVVGLAAAVTLTIEKIEILINPDYVPSCSINPVLSCGSVMITPQASAFGFPNPLIGIVAFTVVLVTGVLALAKVDAAALVLGGSGGRHAARARRSCTG